MHLENSVKNKGYWTKIIPVLIWQALYLAASPLFDAYTRVYCDLIFYLGIAIYFFCLKDWRFSEWLQALKQGKKFWLSVLLTVLGMGTMYLLGFALSSMFPGVDDGMSVFRVHNWATLIAFSLVTIVLAPIAEEVFYRKSIIAFDSRIIIIISCVASMLLYASEHSLVFLGFLQACLWAVPLSLAYIKTKDVYVCMTAHFLCNLLVNGATVLLSGMQLIGL